MIWESRKKLAAGDIGYEVGPGTDYEFIALQIHYQQLAPRAVQDHSGVRLFFTSIPPRDPIDVQLMASFRLRVPPASKMDECVACHVVRGGTERGDRLRVRGIVSTRRRCEHVRLVDDERAPRPRAERRAQHRRHPDSLHRPRNLYRPDILVDRRRCR